MEDIVQPGLRAKNLASSKMLMTLNSKHSKQPVEIDELDVLQAKKGIRKTEIQQKQKKDNIIHIDEYYATQIKLSAYVHMMRFNVFKDEANETLTNDFKVLLQMNPNDNLKFDLMNVINKKDYELFKTILNNPQNVNNMTPNKYIDSIIELYFKHSKSDFAYNVLDHLLELEFDDTAEMKTYLAEFSKLPQDIQGINRSYRG